MIGPPSNQAGCGLDDCLLRVGGVAVGCRRNRVDAVSSRTYGAKSGNGAATWAVYPERAGVRQDEHAAHLGCKNAIALDATQARLMNCDPESVLHLAILAAYGLGPVRSSLIDVRGVRQGSNLPLSVEDVRQPFASGVAGVCALRAVTFGRTQSLRRSNLPVFTAHQSKMDK